MKTIPPYLQKQKLIIRKLRKSCGKDGFDYMAEPAAFDALKGRNLEYLQ